MKSSQEGELGFGKTPEQEILFKFNLTNGTPLIRSEH